MRIQYILHADFERPGIIETWAKQNQFNESYCRPFCGEDLPDSVNFDLLIVMGGPQSPLNVEQAPYLLDEISLIKKTLEMEIPILGFCLGAQLIGEALGARTERSPHKEVGVFPIQLNEEGIADPLFEGIPFQFPAVHWHNDMPGLTNDSKILAFSRGCPRQIVRYQSQVYGFQCHLEPTRENIEAMIHFCPQDLAPGTFVQSIPELLSSDFAIINNTMIEILKNLISTKKYNRI